MLSIGDIVEKLVIENIKIAHLKQQLSTLSEGSAEYSVIYTKMMVLNKNRSVIIAALDEKVERVASGREKNRLLEIIKTY